MRASAGSARRGSRWRSTPSSKAARHPRTGRSTTRSPAICAAAPDTGPSSTRREGRSARPSPRPPRRFPRRDRITEAGAQIFFAPRTLDALIALRAERPDAPILAGGTDLGLLFSKERRGFDAIVSVARVEELCRLEVRDDEIEIGAAVTYTRALPVLDAEYPGMGELIRRIGSRQIRNLGTIGGNIGNASPIGDTLPCLIALDATLMLRGPDGARQIARSRTSSLAIAGPTCARTR